jgi:pyruvate dehydrogenase E2 component (dihydrolipoamide acetyltransferase)
MPAEITMPKLGLTMTTGTIVRWMKSPGERIELGEPLLEISTEKINYEVESTAAGTLAKTIGNAGDEFAPGAVIGIVAADGETLSVAAQAQPVAAQAQPVAARAQPVSARAPATNGARTIASPAARRLARERSIDVRAVRGSGPRGRITLDDVAAYATVAPASPGPSLGYPPELPAARRTIFRRMSEIALLPLAQVETVVNVDALQALIERRGDFGWTAFAVVAAARLLREHPEIRTDARSGAPHPRCDIGVAADTPSGLLVPVVRDAERRTLRETHDEIVRLARAARDGNLAAANFGEAAFAISNVGPQGVQRVAPLVDPPQTAILGMGAATRRPSVVKQPGTNFDVVAPAWSLTLVLSFDHRFIDGAPAARFLAALAARFADPGMLL